MQVVVVLCFVAASVSADSCAYSGCHPVKAGKLNVHLVPHTHDDVGWLKTVDQYYYGSNKVHSSMGVQYILDSVVSELFKNKNRRFIYVESSFLWRWWQEQDAASQSAVVQLVQQGRLVLVHGGWCMSDEASPHYSMLIDQMTFGLKFLKDTFGECGVPKVAWQIDPFGHSTEVALQFAEMGYDAVFFGRIDHEDYHQRVMTKTMEHIWRPDTTLGEIGELFTGILYNLYMAPNGFCFDTYCSDEPIMDNPKLHGYNVNERITDFVREVRFWADAYKSNHVQITMGGDFNYIVAASWFKNMDKLINNGLKLNISKRTVLHVAPHNLIQALGESGVTVTLYVERLAVSDRVKALGFLLDRDLKFSDHVTHAFSSGLKHGRRYINERIPDVNVLYSTPACYLQAIHQENITWPVKDNDDFFPYGSDEHTYWTGYYTSRPNLKIFVYKTNNVLQAVTQQRVLLGAELEEEETLARRAVAITQHHDAVSGTAKQHVTDDYSLYLSEALDASEKIFSATYRKWLGADLSPQKFCQLANVSQCEVVETASRFTVTVYNPLSHAVSHHVRVAVTPASYKVTGPTGEEIPTELVPIPPEVQAIPGRKSNASVELLFFAEDVPALGLLSYHVERFEGGPATPVAEKQNLSLPSQNPNMTAPLETSQEALGDILVDIGNLKLTFNVSTGHLMFVEKDKETWAFHQTFYYYEGSKGYNYNSFNRASGAYIFRPAKEEVDIVSPYANLSIFRGKMVTEIHQQFGSWVSQIIRVYKGSDQIEFDWLVGPIPVEKWIGKEVITRYTTQLLTNGELWTDSNGRRLMRRVRNYRQSWNLTVTEPVASNYYPITSAAAVLGNKHRVTVLTDRPQGAASLRDGQLEIMVHRRLLYDDSKGVGEPLDEVQFNTGLVARGLHIVQLSRTHKQTSRPTLATNGTSTNTTTQSPPLLPETTPYKYQEGAERHRLEALKLVYGPLLTFSRTNLTASEWSKRYRMKYSGQLRQPLPVNVHLLTLSRWTNSSLLVRLEHLFEANEHPNYSKPVSIQLKTLLAEFDVSRAVELSLSANQERAQLSRLQWRHEGVQADTTPPPPLLTTEMIAVLAPMQIRTFQLFVTPRKPSA